MKFLIAMILILFCSQAFACDLTAGVGQTRRLSDQKTGATATVACLYREKWELRVTYFGEQRIYGETVYIAPYATLAVSRVWLFRDGRKIRPLLSAGVALKESQRCLFDGDLDCNRMAPLPFCFLMRAGLYLGDLVASLNHCSNAGFDYGPEKKNLGQDYLMLELRF